MDDKELVEVWRAKFFTALMNCVKNPLSTAFNAMGRDAEGNYINNSVSLAWGVFINCKRSQPSVVLPEPDHYYGDSDHYEAQDVHERLTAAGIKYTIGE